MKFTMNMLLTVRYARLFVFANRVVQTPSINTKSWKFLGRASLDISDCGVS